MSIIEIKSITYFYLISWICGCCCNYLLGGTMVSSVLVILENFFNIKQGFPGRFWDTFRNCLFQRSTSEQLILPSVCLYANATYVSYEPRNMSNNS